MPRTVTLIVDTREQCPLPIPTLLNPWLDPNRLPTEAKSDTVRIEVVKKALEVADYVLDGEAGGVYVEGQTQCLAGVVERKGSIDELGKNVFNTERRAAFIRLLTRMRQRWAAPILLVEGGLTTLLGTPNLRGGYAPGLVVDGLQRLSLEYGVPIQLVDGRGLAQRRYIGEYVARYLVNSAVVGEATWRQTRLPPFLAPSSNSATASELPVPRPGSPS